MPIDTLEDSFLINRQTFAEKFLPLYSDHFSPRVLVQFSILLPLRLPADGVSFTLYDESDVAHTFVFARVPIVEHIPAHVMGPDAQQLPVERLRVEMALVTSRHLLADDENEKGRVELMEAVFNSLFSSLNRLLTAYTVSTADIGVHRVSREMIAPFYFGRYVPLDRWEAAKTGAYVNSAKMPVVPEPQQLTQDELEVWGSNFQRLQTDVFLQLTEIELTASKHLRDGLYSEAVVYSQTAVEFLISALHARLCEVDGVEAFSDVPFASMLKRELPMRLGGNWDLTNVTQPVGKWYNSTYALRNRIAHAGYRPSERESEDALLAAEGFREWLIRRVIAKKARYRELAAYFLEHSSFAEE